MMIRSDYKLHVIKGYLGEIILAEYESGILIFDGGCSCDATRIEDYITSRLKKTMSSIKLIIVSHAHPDHTGGAGRLKKKYNIPVAASSRINNWYSGLFGAIQHKIDIFMGYWVAIRNRKMGFENVFYRRHVSVDFLLKEGSPVPLFRDWEAIETPGHTSHDISFYNRKKACLYAGDVLVKVKEKYLLPFPVSFPLAMKRTLNRLKELEVKILILPHGGIDQVEDFQLIVQKLLKRLKKGPGYFWKKLMWFQRFSPEVRKKAF